MLCCQGVEVRRWHDVLDGYQNQGQALVSWFRTWWAHACTVHDSFKTYLRKIKRSLIEEAMEYDEECSEKMEPQDRSKQWEMLQNGQQLR